MLLSLQPPPLPQDLLPAQRRTAEEFDSYFYSHRLESLVKFRKAQENSTFKNTLMAEIEEMFSGEAPTDEIVERCQQHMTNTTLTDVDIAVMVNSN